MRTKTANLTKEILEQLYLIEKLSSRDIAIKYNVSSSCILRKMKKYGIPVRFKDNTTDLLNQTFGKLTVIKQVHGNRAGAVWLCRCVCGYEKNITASTLKQGLAKSCGKCCYNITYGVIPHRIIGEIQRNAQQRNINYTVTNEYLSQQFIKQNYSCAYTGIELVFANTSTEHLAGLTTASLDRIDSNIGYIEGNVQWIHKDINFMKWKLSETKFLDYITLIYLNRLSNEKINSSIK